MILAVTEDLGWKAVAFLAAAGLVGLIRLGIGYFLGELQRKR